MGRVTRVLMAAAALLLISGAIFHTLAYPKLIAVLNHSDLPGQFPPIFRGLWLSDSASVIFLGMAFGAVAWRPRLATRPLLILLGIMPLLSALSIFFTVGLFFPAYILTVSGLIALFAAAVLPGETAR